MYRTTSEETNIKQDKSIRVNKGIVAQEIRLVDQDGTQVGVVSLKDALIRAEGVGLDLVEIAPNAEPPVCRIMDYGKHLFEINKKKAASRKKQKQIQIKEVKLRPTTDTGDYQVKIRSMMRFLEDGDKVKVTIRFRGRELMHPELGMTLLKKIEIDLTEQGMVEQQPKLEGKQIVMLIGPRKTG
ncbi:MAG: translation initiation factor IF-3 [Gammaproteobacteria bacterium]|nr:translation initiation factor IF-3 [Gammaproteobacteria bacterium]